MSGRWRHLAEVTGPFDRPTPVCYWCSVDIFCAAPTVLELISVFPSRENGPEAEIAARWRRMAAVT
jgi:hypothetical protein